MSKTVEHLMTRVVFVVSPTDRVDVAEATMKQGDVRHLAVVDEAGRCIGMISDKDLVMAGPGAPISAVMSEEPVTIPVTAPAYEAVALMLQHRFNSVPVVDDDGQLEGIITSTDAMIVAYETLAADATPADGPVDADRALLTSKLGRVRESRHPKATATAIGELTSFLKQRFQREEQDDSIFAQIVAEQPEREAEIKAVRAEHTAIIASAERLIGECKGHEGETAAPLAAEAADLVQTIEAHEAFKARLLASSLAAR